MPILDIEIVRLLKAEISEYERAVLARQVLRRDETHGAINALLNLLEGRVLLETLALKELKEIKKAPLLIGGLWNRIESLQKKEPATQGGVSGISGCKRIACY